MSSRQTSNQSGRDSAHGERFVRVVFAFEASLYSALTPMLPHYVHTLSASRSAIGLLAAAYPAGMMGGAIMGRAISRVAGARRTMIVALMAFALSIAAFGCASGLWELGGVRLAEGTACGCLWGSGLAWLVSFSPPERRGAAIGSALSAAVVGTLIGPVVGTLALTLGPRLVFSCVAGVSVILALRMRRSPDAPTVEVVEQPPWRTISRNPRFLLGMWLVLLGASAVGALGTLLPLNLGRLGASSVAIGAIFVLASLLSMAAAPLAGRMSDRLGARIPLAVGLNTTAALAVLLVLPQAAVLLGVLVVLTIGGSLTFYTVPATTYMTSALERLGVPVVTATMLWCVAWSAGETVGAPVAAGLSQAAGNAFPFVLLAALMLLTFGAVRRMVPARRGSVHAGRPIHIAAS